MTCRNYCFVCFGLFLVFQSTPARDSPSPHSDTISDDALIDIPFNPVCPAGCATCSTYNGCVTCQTTHFLLLQWHGMRQTGTCVKACPSGYYGTRRHRHGKCLKCPISNCVECSTNSTCTTCATPFFLSDGRCLERCPKSKPFATKAGLCQKRVDCEMSDWVAWGPCSRKDVKCGTKFGRQTRTRLVLQNPSENGQQCPTTVQSRKCKLQPCDCKVETNELDPLEVGSVDEKTNALPDSPKKTGKPKKPQKKCKQRKNKKQPTKKPTTKSDEPRRKPTATPKPMKKTTSTKKKKVMTTTSQPS